MSEPEPAPIPVDHDLAPEAALHSEGMCDLSGIRLVLDRWPSITRDEMRRGYVFAFNSLDEAVERGRLVNGAALAALAALDMVGESLAAQARMAGGVQ